MHYGLILANINKIKR